MFFQVILNARDEFDKLNVHQFEFSSVQCQWCALEFNTIPKRIFYNSPLQTLFKLFVQFTCYNCWKNPQTSRTFSFCCIQFSQQYYVRLLFDLNATAAISVDSVHQEIIPFTFCSNRVNCYAVREILLNRKKLSKNTTYRMILPQIVNICRMENVNTVNVKSKVYCLRLRHMHLHLYGWIT